MTRKDTEKTRHKMNYVYWKEQVITLRNEFEACENLLDLFEIDEKLTYALCQCEIMEFDKRMESNLSQE